MAITEVQPTTAPQIKPPANTGWVRWVLACGLVVLVVAFYALGLQRYLAWDSIKSNLDTWKTWVDQHLLLAVGSFFLFYVAVTALSLPVAGLLSLVAGALFGRWLGTGVVSLGSTLGATLAFLITRYLLRDWVQRRFARALEPINRGIDQDGAWYLFTLRLVPVMPFFLVNLGMALTSMRALTFAFISWLGMLLGTFLYVNVGTELQTLDSPNDLLSAKVLGSLALLGLVPLVLRKLITWQVRWRTVVLVLTLVLLVGIAAASVRTLVRYQTAAEMQVPVREFSNAEYPEDPANRSLHHGQYNGRTLRLVKKDDTHFDFIFEPQHAHIAEVVFRDVDVSLMTPGLPYWTRKDAGLQRIALTDRQWNRQQVRFGEPGTAHVEVRGGDGFEAKHLFSAELAKNCLNAGYWEVLLNTREAGEKALYYQGWFTFPLGHYKTLFEHNTGLLYLQHWYYLEHWFDPAGTPMPLEGLRTVVDERKVPASFDLSENVIFGGEQARKRRTTMDENIVTWNNYYDGSKIRFATFIPPGRYSVSHPWRNEYRRISHFEQAIYRNIKSPASDATYQEIELVFSRGEGEPKYRILVSGFEAKKLLSLPVKDYSKGLYMPMGIGTPPFYQAYEELQQNPPDRSPYFSLLLDEAGRWVDHHQFAIDGPVLHRDEKNPDQLHVYLLSYERQTLIAHLVLSLKP